MIVNQDGALFTGSISDGIQRCTVTYPSGESIASERPSATGEIVQGYISERFGGVRSTDLERYDVIFQFAPDAGSRAGQLSLSDSPEFYGDLGDIQTAPQWRANRMAGPVWMTYRLEPGVGEPGGVYRGPGDWVATRSAAQPSGPIQWRLEDGGNGHYYQLSLTLDNPGDHYLSWTQARALAETLSFVGVQGHLVTLTSAEENAWVVQHIAPASRNPAPLLGGFQPPGSSEPDGEWQWVTGEPFVYTNWAPLEPNEAVPGADYLVYTADPEPTVGTWNDVADLVSAYIVEFDTIPTTPIGAAPLARRVPTPGDTPR